MFSITSNSSPRPKLRVTKRSRTPAFPHEAQSSLDGVDGDDEEYASRADFDDGFGQLVGERETADDAFDFPRLAVFLLFDDLACEDDAFEVENVEVISSSSSAAWIETT